MNFLISLFWIGVWISLAIFMVNVVFYIGTVLIALLFSLVGYIWDKLTNKE